MSKVPATSTSLPPSGSRCGGRRLPVEGLRRDGVGVWRAGPGGEAAAAPLPPEPEKGPPAAPVRVPGPGLAPELAPRLAPGLASQGRARPAGRGHVGELRARRRRGRGHVGELRARRRRPGLRPTGRGRLAAAGRRLRGRSRAVVEPARAGGGVAGRGRSRSRSHSRARCGRLRGLEVLGEFPPHPEEALLQGAVAGQLAGRNDPADPAVDHDRDVLRDGRRDPDVLLDEEDGDVALLREGREQLLELGDDEGGESLGRLVEHEEPRVLEEGARDGEHLLLAAGELPAPVPPPLGEPRKHVVHPLHGPRPAAPAGEAQVLVHAEGRPEPAPLGGVGDAPGGHLVGGEAGDVPALEADRASPNREETHDGVAEGGLPHAVPADHRMDAFVQGEVDSLQGMGLVVVDVQAADLQRDRRRRAAARAFGPPVGPRADARPLSHVRARGKAPAPPNRPRSPPGSPP